MTQQFLHNVTPGPRQFVTQAGGQAGHVINGGRPTIDSRHLAAPGVPVSAASPFSGPEFERNARALVSLVEMYANQIAASGTMPLGVTLDDLKQLPLARLQQLAMQLPTKPTANAQPAEGEFAGYDPSNPMGSVANASAMPDGEVLRLTSEVARLVQGASMGALARYGAARLEALRDHLEAELTRPAG
jgi:hypothetical protein